jgi:23S rRNA (pseudouridine1915-N3)-methyltransferase
MLKIRIISVGRRTDAEYENKVTDYIKRLSGFAVIEWILIDPVDGKMSNEQQRNKESDLIKSKLKNSTGSVVLLDERGQSLDNYQLAKSIQNLTFSSNEINFIIGGAFGVTSELRDACSKVISLSRLVFPHELVRLILIEQIYRSYSIINNMPYHHK